MQIEWTNQIIILLAVTCIITALLTGLIATLIQSRKITTLSNQLEQSDTSLDDLNQQYQATSDELDSVKHDLHSHDIAQSKHEQQIANLQATEARLQNEIDQHKAAKQSLDTKHEKVIEQLNSIVKQHEATLADIRGFKNQTEELRERLAKAESAKQTADEEIKRLNQAVADEGKRAEGLDKSLEEARIHFREQREALAEHKKDYANLLSEHQKLTKTHAELNTTLEKREEHFKEQILQLSETKQSMTKEFENLASKIFEEKGKTFTRTSQTSIDSMLKPFREQIEGFQKRVNDVHDQALKGNSSLNAEIRKVLDIGMKMSDEANNLTSALKGDSQQRGAWGEAQLHRTLEMSGLVEDAHFEKQSAFKDAEGKNKQTDYLVKLPDGKHIIIDSKVSLVAYDRAIGAESPEEYNVAMTEHIKSVRKHIDDLASKDYTNLIGMHSPSFVLMFMPIEPAYIEALKNNKDLFEYGYKKNIVLVSHTTLIPILRTVSNLWMIERSNTEAREISEKAGDIYNSVCTVAERLSKLGGTLNTASNHYNNTVKALAGQQGLYGKVERFTKLSAKVTKSLPALEPSHVDFEHDRLALVVEAIDGNVGEELAIQQSDANLQNTPNELSPEQQEIETN
jgi:DNA recombination protein RmuC